MTDTEFLNWMAARVVNVYGESQFVDFVHRLKEIAEKLDRKVITFDVGNLSPKEANEFFEKCKENFAKRMEKK